MGGFAPGCGDGAVGEGAALVAGGEGGALGGGEEAGFAAEVEDFAVGAQEGGDDVGVAGDFAQGGRGDGAGEREGSCPCFRAVVSSCGGGGVGGEEVPVVDGGDDLGSVAAGGGQGVGGECGFGGGDEAVELLLGAGAPVQVGQGGVLLPCRWWCGGWWRCS